MRILFVILITMAFVLAVVDTLFTIALWVINKIDEEETEENEKRDL